MGCNCSTPQVGAPSRQTQSPAASVHEDEHEEISLLNVIRGAELHAWDGWGTTLCWWATALGDSEQLADLFFTLDDVAVHGQVLPGLGLNIARYCIGGSSSKKDQATGRHMKASTLSPWYKHTPGFLVESGSSSSMEDQSSRRWDWGADRKQVRMLHMAKARGVNFLEAFSNSPMWWMTKNYSTMGGEHFLANNLRETYFEDFAKYLAITVQHFKEHKGIEFTSISPFNEPVYAYNKLIFPMPQERCGFDPSLQAWILGYLHHELQERGLSGVTLTASDETSAKHAVATWDKLSTASLPHKHDLHGKRPQELVRKWNVHGYEKPSADDLKQVHKAHRHTSRPLVLWMSEYDDLDESGLTLAKEIHRHMRHMKPTGWCLWQVVDPEWGLLECQLKNSTRVHIRQKYYIFAHFTRHIRPTMSIVSVSGNHVVAAYDASGHVLALVATNLGTSAQTFTYDLGDFAVQGSITRWCTNFEGHDRYTKYDDVRLIGTKLEVHFPAKTIMSFQFEDTHVSTFSV